MEDRQNDLGTVRTPTGTGGVGWGGGLYQVYLSGVI